MTSEPSRIFGLVAGLGVGAGIFYYKSLVDAHLARGLSPRLLIVHADVRYVMTQVAARDTKKQPPRSRAGHGVRPQTSSVGRFDRQ